MREKKQTDSIDPAIRTLANGRKLEESVCRSCGAKKARFVKASAAPTAEMMP